jgi:hypothetical protein
MHNNSSSYSGNRQTAYYHHTHLLQQVAHRYESSHACIVQLQHSAQGAHSSSTSTSGSASSSSSSSVYLHHDHHHPLNVQKFLPPVSPAIISAYFLSSAISSALFSRRHVARAPLQCPVHDTSDEIWRCIRVSTRVCLQANACQPSRDALHCCYY